jgi:hypothetical protein
MLTREYSNNTRKQKKNTNEQVPNEQTPKRPTLYSIVYGPTPVDTPRRGNDSGKFDII